MPISASQPWWWEKERCESGCDGVDGVVEEPEKEEWLAHEAEVGGECVLVSWQGWEGWEA